MSETTNTVTTPGEPTLDALHTVALSAVADLDRVKAASGNESADDAAARIFRNTNEDEVPGIDAVRERILAIVAEERANSGDLSDEQKSEIRKSARERYNSAKTTFETLVRLGAATPAEGYAFPEAPGGSRGPSGPMGPRGFESPRNMSHTATVDGKTVEGSFAVIAKAAGVDTKTVVETLKEVVGTFDDLTVESGPVDWAFDGGDKGNITVRTVRTK